MISVDLLNKAFEVVDLEYMDSFYEAIQNKFYNFIMGKRNNTATG